MKYKNEIDNLNTKFKSEINDQDHLPPKCVSDIDYLEQLRKNPWNCPHFTKWSEWSQCDKSGSVLVGAYWRPIVKCGIGEQTRSRECLMDNFSWTPKSNRMGLDEERKVSPILCVGDYKEERECVIKCAQRWTGLN